MKVVIIILLAGLVVFFRFNVSVVQKELQASREYTLSLEERVGLLQKELIRLNRAYDDKSRIIAATRESVAQLESKVPLDTLQRYIPAKKWEEIKPLVDRLKAFEREGGDVAPSIKYE